MSDIQSVAATLPSESNNHEDDSLSLEQWLVDQGDEIGKGIHGVVYSFKSDSSMVLKEILSDQISTLAFKTLLERLHIFANLNHPNIISHQEVLENDVCICLRMKRYDTSLDAICRSYRRRKQAFPQKLIFSIIRQAAAGLAYLHGSHGGGTSGESTHPLVHGNLKPTNILTTRDESEFVISDAGMYGDDLEALNSTSTLLQIYLAPEALLHGQYLPASDIWSLGVILYELATGAKVTFLKGDLPQNVFVEGWKPDLSEVKDPTFRAVLEHIFILDPSARITADELAGLFCEGVPPICIVYMLKTKCLECDLRECRRQIDALNHDNLELKAQVVKLLAPTSSTEHVITISSGAQAAPAAPTVSQEVTSQQQQQHQQQTKPLFPPKLKLTTLTKLMTAARSNNTAIAKSLIASKTGVRARDDMGMTALMHAARTQSIDVARLLINLEQGMQDHTGKTALIHAAIDGRLTMVKYLLDYEKKLRDIRGMTALMYTVIYGHKKVVPILKDDECRLQDSKGQTALMHAADNNNCGIINILAQQEAMIKDANGHTAFMHALVRGHKEAATLLLQYDDPVDDIGRTALMRAADENRVDVIPFLIPLQKGLRTQEEEALTSYFITGRTALMGATLYNSIDAIRLLVEHEARIQDSNGYTALMFAAQTANYEATQILLPYEKGIVNSQGQTAAILAEEYNCHEIIDLMKPYKEEMDSLKRD